MAPLPLRGMHYLPQDFGYAKQLTLLTSGACGALLQEDCEALCVKILVVVVFLCYWSDNVVAEIKESGR